MRTVTLRSITMALRTSTCCCLLLCLVLLITSCAATEPKPASIIPPQAEEIVDAPPVIQPPAASVEPKIEAPPIPALDITGRWIGSWQNQWAESDDFMFTIDQNQDGTYHMAVFSSCDQNADLIVEMNAPFKDNTLTFQGNGSMWNGTGTALLENETLKGSFTGNESGTFTLNKVITSSVDSVKGKWCGNRSDQWGWTQQVFARITANSPADITIEIFESADMLYTIATIPAKLDSNGKILFDQTEIYGNAYHTKNTLIGRISRRRVRHI